MYNFIIHIKYDEAFSFHFIFTPWHMHLFAEVKPGKYVRWRQTFLFFYSNRAERADPYFGRGKSAGVGTGSNVGAFQLLCTSSSTLPGKSRVLRPIFRLFIKGKVKSIGTCFITYYGANETEQKRGKPKSFGSLYLDYYSNYDEKRLQGKLKMLGTLSFEYYRPYENEAYRGKLKSIGSTAITYYSAFDDRYNTGKIKTIGAVSYVWHSPLNHTYLRGGLKTNNYRQVISGTTYVLQ